MNVADLNCSRRNQWSAKWLLMASVIGPLALCLPSSLWAQGRSKMIWSDRGANTVRRSNLDGSDVEILASGMSQIRGVALDRENNRLYWADNGSNKIQRSLLDGSMVEDLVTEGLEFPAGIALDVQSNLMYWADATNGKIQRANLDGSNVVDFIPNLVSPYFVTLDLANQHIYWTDQRSFKVQRANLDGTNVVDLVTDLSLPRGVDINLEEGRLYWADRTLDVVQRSLLDGSNIETIHTATPSRAAPHGVAVHASAGHVYWVDNGLVTLKRANLDGTDPITLFDDSSGQLTRPWQIVLDLRETPSTDYASSIDQVTQLIHSGQYNAQADYNLDGSVTSADREFVIHYTLNSGLGDANLDGWFDSSDLVSVFTSGEYEDTIAGNSTWATGDWNGDTEFTSSDFVDALSKFTYTAVRPAPASAVPEPGSQVLLLTSWLVWQRTRRRI